MMAEGGYVNKNVFSFLSKWEIWNSHVFMLGGGEREGGKKGGRDW